MRIGKSLIERRDIKPSKGFRYIIIENDFLKDTTIFQFPLALQKLGLFVMELYHEQRSKAGQKALVLFVKNA